jgi:hypothetical protein
MYNTHDLIFVFLLHIFIQSAIIFINFSVAGFCSKNDTAVKSSPFSFLPPVTNSAIPNYSSLLPTHFVNGGCSECMPSISGRKPFKMADVKEKIKMTCQPEFSF